MFVSLKAVFIIETDLNECRKRFATQLVMDSHKRREHTVSALPTTRVPTVCPPIHRCLVSGCGLEFAGEYTLRAHQRAVHKEPTPAISFSYDTNGVGSDSAVGLTPGPTHTSHRRFVRSQTSKTGVHSSSAAKRYGCRHDRCGRSFATALALKQHNSCVHSAIGGQYRCDFCAKIFYHKYSYDQHCLTVHSAATTHVLQAPIETGVIVPYVVMEATVPDCIPIAPTTVLPWRCLRISVVFIFFRMSSSDSFSPTYESFVPKWRSKKTLKCDYNECHKQFVTRLLLGLHKLREHSVCPLPRTRVPTVCPPIYRCLVSGCGLGFAGEYTLNAHQRAGHKDPTPVMSCETNDGDKQGVHSASAVTKRHDCAHDGCGQSYASEKALKKHLRCVHSATGGQYRCDDCIQRFYNKRTLDEHRLTVHSAVSHALQAPIETELNVPFVALETITEYIRIEPTAVLPVRSTTATTKPNNSPLDSDVEVMDVLPAYKRLVRVRPITRHKSMPAIIDLSDTSSDKNSGHESADSRPEVMAISHFSGSLYTCDIDDCGQRFGWQGGLDCHLLSVHTIAVCRAHPCGQCERSFDTVDQWADHKLECWPTIWSLHCLDSDLGDNPYVTAEGELNNWVHRRPGRPSPAPRIPCGECDSSFNTDAQLGQHLTRRHSHPLLDCDKCGHKQFRSRLQLIGHQYTAHSQPMPDPFTCV
ncbi:unnamed protein product, partial [Medioppia subpectinata]